jgi:hypothetical protein
MRRETGEIRHRVAPAIAGWGRTSTSRIAQQRRLANDPLGLPSERRQPAMADPVAFLSRVRRSASPSIGSHA